MWMKIVLNDFNAIFDGFRGINKSMKGFWIGFGVVSCCADDGLLTKLKN